MKFSVTLLATISMMMILPTSAQAESGEGRLYINSGISWLNSDVKTEQAWMSSIGYNYLFNPTIGLDIGYLDVSSDDTYTSRYSTLMPTVTYKGVFGGAKVQQPIANFATLYAKGGLSLTSYQENLSQQESDESLDSYVMAPYFSIGANIPSLIQPSLDLNVELSYQNLELDYNNTVLMVGGQYRF